eukprot:Rmarinus@m.7066
MQLRYRLLGVLVVVSLVQLVSFIGLQILGSEQKYLVLRHEVHPHRGLTNQKLIVFHALAVASKLGRTLLIPKLRPELGNKDLFVNFDEVFDFKAFDYAVHETYPSLPEKELLWKICEATCEEKFRMYQPIEYYVDTCGSFPETILCLENEPFMAFEVPQFYPSHAALFPALVPAPWLRNLINELPVTAAMESLVAVHLRVENDWRDHKARIGELYLSSAEIEQIVRKHMATEGEGSPGVVFLAVGDDVDGDPAAPWAEHGWDVRSTHVPSELSYLEKSLVDFDIVLRGALFYGVDTSTFSMAAVRERCYRKVVCRKEFLESFIIVPGSGVQALDCDVMLLPEELEVLDALPVSRYPCHLY